MDTMAKLRGRGGEEGVGGRRRMGAWHALSAFQSLLPPAHWAGFHLPGCSKSFKYLSLFHFPKGE